MKRIGREQVGVEVRALGVGADGMLGGWYASHWLAVGCGGPLRFSGQGRPAKRGWLGDQTVEIDQID